MTRRSILHNNHLSAGATMKQYGAWEMPAKFTDKEQEYQTVRERIGLFDFSCITMIKVTGESAIEFLDQLCTGNVSAMSEGKIINTLLCNDEGKMIAIIWLLMDDGCFYIHSDAEKQALIWEWLNQRAKEYSGEAVVLEDISEAYGCLAVIGPGALEIPKRLISEDTIGLSYLGFEHDVIDDVECVLCRYGYAGEYEYRLIVPKDSFVKVWEKVEEIGAEEGLARCGLDILDTLLLEMKSVNQNRDILESVTPLQAGLHWMIYFRKDAFIGKDKIFKEKENGLSCKLLSVVLEEGGPLQEGASIYWESEKIGFIVHSEYSLTLKKEIGVAYIDMEYAWVGLEFTAETKNKEMRNLLTVSAPLFITNTIIRAREG